MHCIRQRFAALVVALASNGAVAQFCPQDFDGVAAPALPPGWSASADGASTGWAADTSQVDSPPNAVFSANAAAVGNGYLVSPPTIVAAGQATITFRHHYATESTFDGGVLEISTGGGPFLDILDAGGSFISGGYNGTISFQFKSPIAGRQAWTGDSGGYTTTIVRLPAAAVGANATLRWRMASDRSIASVGWYLDSIACGEGHDDTDSPWTYGTSYPIPILDQATTVMDGVLYSFGGVSNVAMAAAYKFDGAQWTPIGDLPEALEGSIAVNDGTFVYVLGGARADSTVSNALYRYSPQTNTYETLTPMPTAGWAFGATVLGGRIVRFGGKLAGSAVTNVTEIYDIATHAWSAGAAYPASLGFVSAFARGAYVYGAGGVGDAASAKTYRYDPAANVWDDAPIPDLPDLRWGATTIAVPEGVVIAGGYEGGISAGDLTKSAIVWNAAANAWRPFDPLIVARARMSGGSLRGRPIVIGGRDENGGFAGTVDVQVLDRIFANGFDAPG